MTNVINKNRKKIICGVIIIAALFIGVLSLIALSGLKEYEYYTTYCEDYYSVIANTDSTEYEDLIAINGEPESIRREKLDVTLFLIKVEYDDGRLFVFRDNKQRKSGGYSLSIMELTSPEYRFGSKEIGIGTDKSAIEEVYRKSYQGLKLDGYGEFYYVEDGNSCVCFYFDENEKVSKMVIGRAEIMHGIHGWKKKQTNDRGL
ncbi:MAG: hypothetical protein NC313_05170 [Butyrivibrio sp.]|nr:hypothetical protein [Butyrivibrio sp.]